MSTTEELINKYYNDKEELEKMAQFEMEKRAAFSTLEKIANEAQLDLSQLNEGDKINLWNYLISEMSKDEAANTADPQAQVAQTTQPAVEQPAVNGQAPQAQPVGQQNGFMDYMMADPQRAQDFQYKMAEAQITSDFWAENAAEKFLNKVAFGMAKIAEAMEGKEEPKKEEGHGSPFEALAKERAMKMKEEHEKKAAFDELLNQRALELLQEGKV